MSTSNYDVKQTSAASLSRFINIKGRKLIVEWLYHQFKLITPCTHIKVVSGERRNGR